MVAVVVLRTALGNVRTLCCEALNVFGLSGCQSGEKVNKRPGE